MDSSTSYQLTEDSFKNYEALLTAQGFDVVPMTRTTHEGLRPGAISMFSISGILKFQSREYGYAVQEHGCSRQLVLGPTICIPEALAAAILRAFPEAASETPPVVAEEIVKPRWTLGTVLMFGGCFTFLLFFAAVCFFAIVGIRSSMR